MPKLSFLIFCLMFFTASFGVAAMAALVPQIALYFGVSAKHALQLTWIYMLPYGLFALLWGPLTRTFTVKRLLLISTFGFFLSSLFFSMSFNIRQAFIFRFFMGCFGCGFVPLSLITIGKAVSADEKSKHIGIFFAVSYISTFVSVFLSGFAGWRTIYFIPAVLSLAVFFLILKNLGDFDFRKDKFRISYSDTFRDRGTVSFFAVVILGSFFYHSVQQRLGVYLHEAYSLNQPVISSVFTIATLSAIIFEFVGGFLSAKTGNINVARAGFIAMSLFFPCLLFMKGYHPVFFAVVLWGAGWALTHVGLSSQLTHFPDKFLRDASSLNSALRFSFGGLGAFLGGVVVAVSGFKVLFVTAGLSIFVLGVYLNKVIPKREECYE